MKINIFGFAATSVFTFSCQKIEKIEMSGNIKPGLVINSVQGDMNATDFFLFDVSKSLSAVDNAPIKPVINAKIELRSTSGEFETIVYNSLFKTYVSKSIKYKKGEIYTLKAWAPGFDTVYASFMMPFEPVVIKQAQLKLQNIRYYTYFQSDSSYQKQAEMGTLRFTFTDNPGQMNSYIFRINPVWKSGLDKHGTLWICDYPGVEIVGNYYQQEFYLDDALFNGKEVTVETRFANPYNLLGDNKDSVIAYNVELLHVNADLYKYWFTLAKSRENSGNPFEEPVQIFSNIKNGYGVFGGYYRFTLQVPL